MQNYERHLVYLLQWLEDMGLPASVLLVTPQSLIDCCEHIFDAGYCYSTPNTVRSAVALEFRRAVRDPPYPTDHPAFKSALKGYKRLAACRSVRREAIFQSMLARLVEHVRLWLDPGLLLYTEAAYRLGYEALMRIAEVKGLWPQHVTFQGDAVLIYIAMSKTDQLRRGITVKCTCPILRILMGRLVALAGHGPLFPVAPSFLNMCIRAVARLEGWRGYFSFHSLRHGHASEIWMATHDLNLLMSVGRWVTRAAARWYIHLLTMPRA